MSLLLEIALDTRHDLDAALDVLVSRGEESHGRGAALAEEIEEAAHRHGYRRAAVRAMLGRAHLVLARDPVQAEELLAEAAPMVEAEGTVADRVYYGTLVARARLHDGDAPGAHALLRALEADAWSLGPSHVQAFYFRWRLLSAEDAANYAEAVRYGFHLRAVGEEIAEPTVTVTALSNLAVLFADAGSYAEALRLAREAQGLMREHRFEDWSTVTVILGLTLLELGRHEEAWADLEPLIEGEIAAFDPRAANMAELLAAEVLFHRGDLDQARRLASRALDVAREQGPARQLVRAAVLMAELALEADDPAQAQAHLETVPIEGYPTAYSIRLQWTASRVAAAAGEWEQAYREIVEYVELQQRLRATTVEIQSWAHQIEEEVRSMREERDAALRRLSEVEQVRAELADLAAKDPLTRLANRRGLDTYLAELYRRPGTQFCLAIIDLDRFKAVNDTYGHAAGDAVLAALATLLAGDIRTSDFACRYGGEEFVLVLHHLDTEQAAAIVENMLAKFRTVTITHGEHTLSGLTFSAGIAEYASEKDRATVFDQADAALYTVKQSTRDAVEVYQAPPLPNRPAGGSE